MTTQNYQHFRMELDDHQILWLTLDRKDGSVNSLNQAVFDEFESAINEIAVQNPKGVILLSGKKRGFIAGADITQFTAITTTQGAFEIIRQAQLVLDKLEALPMPTVAMINGFCLGGGLEVALACRYRVALDEPGTQIGLPEVKLGLHPGWGGTVRLPRLIGAVQAMQIMLPGKSLSAAEAAKLGVVDAAVPLRELKRAAIHFILKQPPAHQPSTLARWSNEAFVRPLLGKIFYRQLKSRVKQEHYPAPYAIVRNWIQEGVHTTQAYVTEAHSIAELMITPTSRNLVRVFFLQDRLKALSKGITFKANHVHVVGAGTMGGDIAAWCVLKGLSVTLQDKTPQRIAPAMARAREMFKKKLRKSHLIQAAMDRLLPDCDGLGVKKADVVIEAIFEDLNAKQALLKTIEQQLKPGAILATNTSSIPLDELNIVLNDPSRLVGLHFFNPVDKMQLVEVVSGNKTASASTHHALAFTNQLGRLPLSVSSTPGFLINRVLMPYLMEAMILFEEGIPATIIDQTAVDFGMPMGPIALADKVGLDICLSVAEKLVKYYGGEVPGRLIQMVKEGKLGVKTGEGFYRYQKGKLVPEKKSAPVFADICDRLILRMLNESAACLQERVVENSDLLDAGMIFGTGFAPFRGGPIHYAQHRGIPEIIQRLEQLAQIYGERFKPQSAWNNMLKKEQ